MNIKYTWHRVCLSLLLAVPFAVSAVPMYELQATSLDPTKYSDFTIQFTDTDLDSLLDLDEITAFSGITLISFFGVVDTVENVANIAGITDSLDDTWYFSKYFPGGDSLHFNPLPEWYSYDLNGVNVPEPSIMALLASGLIAIGVVRRKNRT